LRGWQLLYGHQSQAQIEAFGGTWHWNEPAKQAIDEGMQSGNSDAAEMDL
jgi:hypothetical protein